MLWPQRATARSELAPHSKPTTTSNSNGNQRYCRPRLFRGSGTYARIAVSGAIRSVMRPSGQLALLAVLLFAASGASVLQHASPPPSGWAIALLAAPAVLLGDAAHKWVMRRRRRRQLPLTTSDSSA